MSNANLTTTEGVEYFSTDHLTPQLKVLAIRATGAVVFASALINVITIVGSIILSRLLTPSDFGLVAMVIIIGQLLANFGGNGFTEAIIQEERITHSQISTLFWLNTAISAALTLLFMASAPALVFFFKDERIFLITVVLAALIIINGLATQHLALLNRTMQFYRISANGIVAILMSFIVAIAMALLGFGYWSLIAKHVVFYLSTTIGAWFLCRWRPGLPNKCAKVKNMIKFALNVYMNFSITYLSRSIDKILVGRFYGSSQLGQYDRAFFLSSTLHNQITVAVSNVAVATLSRLRNDPDKCLQYFIKVLSIIAFFGMPLSAVFTIIGRELVLLVLGEQWTEAGNILIAFSTGIGIMLMYGTHVWLHYSMGRADRLFKWTIVGTVVTVVFFLVGIPFGALGVAAAYSASYYVLIIPGLLYAGQPIHLKLSHILSAVWKCFAAALLSGLLCCYIYSSTFVSEFVFQLNIIVRVLVASVCCLALYLVILIILYQGFSAIIQFFVVLRDMVPGPLTRKKNTQDTDHR
jgi:PST family polysaccharide transporter